jgi:hydrogenase expression/formation protein HypC
MCLAIPMEVIMIEGETATCTIENVSVKVSVSLVPSVKVGNWVIVHAGFAIEILDEAEARETIRLFQEIEDAYKGSMPVTESS